MFNINISYNSIKLRNRYTISLIHDRQFTNNPYNRPNKYPLLPKKTTNNSMPYYINIALSLMVNVIVYTSLQSSLIVNMTSLDDTKFILMQSIFILCSVKLWLTKIDKRMLNIAIATTSIISLMCIKVLIIKIIVINILKDLFVYNSVKGESNNSAMAILCIDKIMVACIYAFIADYNVSFVVFMLCISIILSLATIYKPFNSNVKHKNKLSKQIKMKPISYVMMCCNAISYIHNIAMFYSDPSISTYISLSTCLQLVGLLTAPYFWNLSKNSELLAGFVVIVKCLSYILIVKYCSIYGFITLGVAAGWIIFFVRYYINLVDAKGIIKFDGIIKIGNLVMFVFYIWYTHLLVYIFSAIIFITLLHLILDNHGKKIGKWLNNNYMSYTGWRKRGVRLSLRSKYNMSTYLNDTTMGYIQIEVIFKKDVWELANDDCCMDIEILDRMLGVVMMTGLVELTEDGIGEMTNYEKAMIREEIYEKTIPVNASNRSICFRYDELISLSVFNKFQPQTELFMRDFLAAILFNHDKVLGVKNPFKGNKMYYNISFVEGITVN